MNTPTAIQPDLQLDEYGQLSNPQDWNKELALILAYDLGINPLNNNHWKVIDAMRAHYERFGVAPAIHNICHTNHQNEQWVHNLFGNCMNAWRIAGLPDPGEEAKAYLSDM